jgi:Resolvase, N terminal domain/Helix-turn-helix domain of resolvase
MAPDSSRTWLVQLSGTKPVGKAPGCFFSSSTVRIASMASEIGLPVSTSLKSLGEPWADTTTPAGETVLTVFAGIAEFGRALIRDRTGAGRVAAKKRGVRFGRKPKLTPEQIVLALQMVNEWQPVPPVADASGVHETTIYRCLSAAEVGA